MIVLCQEEALLLNHGYLGTEHLLLGLIREGEGVAAKVLDGLGVTLEDVRNKVEEIIGMGGATPSGRAPFTPRAKKVFKLSLREALMLGHSYMGTEHILLGLVREGEGVGAQVLVKMGVDLADVRKAVIELLASYAAAEAERAEMEQDRIVAHGSPPDLRVPFPFPLRPDFLASLELPADLTHKEAERISAYVLAIAEENA